MKRWLGRPFLMLFAVALMVRLGLLAVTYAGPEKVEYWEAVAIAQKLVKGEGYTIDWRWRSNLYNAYILGAPLVPRLEELPPRVTAMKDPVYPWFVAGVFRLFGLDNFLALFLIQAVLSAWTCTLMGKAASTWSYPAGVVTAGLLALYPPFAFHAVTSTENTALALFVASALIRVGSAPIADWGQRAVWLGILGGALTLTESVLMFFALGFVLVGCFLRNFGMQRRLVAALVALAVFLAVQVPWWTRNALVFQELAFSKPHVGYSWLRSVKHAGYPLADEEVLDVERRGRELTEPGEDHLLMDLAWRKIRERPSLLVAYSLRSLGDYWFGDKGYAGLRFLVGRQLPYWALLVAALPALAVCSVHRRRFDFAPDALYLLGSWILILTCSGVYALFGAWNLRYHFPVELVLAPFAAVSLVWLFRRNLPFRLPDFEHTR
ncbi:MAG: hypothetical protein Kow001_12140 [Acidobacteriota bacterium]